MYRPLPQCLTIKHSDIEGLGLFATENIPKNCELGITHVADDRFENKYIRTPLGGFCNHSENPNCEAVKKDDFVILRTIKKIMKDEEITAKYWLYKMR